MKRKQLLCAVLTLVLLFSIQSIARAANTDNQRSTIIKADCRLPIIRVTVPTYASVYINPLKIPVSIGSGDDDDQIISTPACIANMSEVPLVVDVTVTGAVKPGSDMTLSQFPTKGLGTNKSAFIYFEIVQSNSDDPDFAKWNRTYDESKHHIAIVSGVPITREKIFTLPAQTMDGEVAKGGYAPFRLTGDAVTNPTNAWNSRDGINVTVAFTFTPIPLNN